MKLLSRRRVQHDVHVVVQLKERRRQLRRQRTVDDALDARRPSTLPVASSTIARECRIVAIPTDSASGGTFAGSPPKSAALLRRVSGLQRDAVRPRHAASAPAR